jgi:hypothetical protein
MATAVVLGFLAAMAMVGLALLGTWLLWSGLRGHVEHRRACRGCGYDLRGHTSRSIRCPECGLDLKPRDVIIRCVHHVRQTRLILGGSLLFLGILSSVPIWAPMAKRSRPVAAGVAIAPPSLPQSVLRDAKELGQDPATIEIVDPADVDRIVELTNAYGTGRLWEDRSFRPGAKASVFCDAKGDIVAYVKPPPLARSSGPVPYRRARASTGEAPTVAPTDRSAVGATRDGRPAPDRIPALSSMLRSAQPAFSDPAILPDDAQPHVFADHRSAPPIGVVPLPDDRSLAAISRIALTNDAMEARVIGGPPFLPAWISVPGNLRNRLLLRLRQGSSMTQALGARVAAPPPWASRNPWDGPVGARIEPPLLQPVITPDRP